MINGGSKINKKKNKPIKRGSIKFSTHPLAVNWSTKNKIYPKDVSISSHLYFWFDCPKCKHDFETCPNYLKGKKTSYCPYCSSKKLCDCEKIGTRRPFFQPAPFGDKVIFVSIRVLLQKKNHYI